MIAGATTKTVVLKVPRQQNTEWCWAAVTTGVDHFFRVDSTHTQCDVAASVLNLKCCDDGKPSSLDACNVPHTLHTVLGRFHLLAGDAISTSLPFDRIRSEIDKGRPVCILVRWLDNQGELTARGHFLAINGYRLTAAQKQFVSLTDPIYGASEIAFDELSNSKGGYRDGRAVWSASFLVANEAAS